jgi:hypothetical protein
MYANEKSEARKSKHQGNPKSQVLQGNSKLETQNDEQLFFAKVTSLTFWVLSLMFP